MKEESNRLQWDLESIFPGGSDSEEFAEFRRILARDLEKAQKSVEELPHVLDEESSTKWIAFMLMVQDMAERISHAESFASCLQAQDVTDDKAMDLLEEVSTMEAAWSAVMTGIDAFALGLDDDGWERLISHEKLSRTAFYWNERRRIAKLKMEPKLEKLTAELSVNGYHAWNRLYEKLAGDLRAEFVENGETKTLSMGQLHNKLSLPDRDIRRQAFDKLEDTWRSVEGVAAMALNSQAGYRLAMYKARGWESPLFEPLLMNRMTQESIDAMWSAVAAGRGKMEEYIGAKKRLLGIEDFRWYDQIAPLGAVQKTYSYDEACDFVVEHLGSFSPELGDFARRAIDKRWIEGEDRAGKAAGGFCTGFPLKKQSRIFMTFSGDYEQMMTLAHELGHAYHSWVLWGLDHFARRYPMNLAETASTFNELLVTDAALNAAGDEKEKLSLLDKKVQESFVMFCNLRARYIFDTDFYQERKKGVVPKEQLSELMVEAQKGAFGDMLCDDGYHPLFWASKMHFFITDVPFYNFPYTFGHLFAGGIYDRARKEGGKFADRYRALLADTGSMTAEQAATKHLGVELTGDTFWKDAVDRVLMDVDAFIKLATS